ncbi:MAG: hypothetical protein ACOH2B_13535 [Burkholderiaceae bacterium]
MSGIVRQSGAANLSAFAWRGFIEAGTLAVLTAAAAAMAAISFQKSGTLAS